MGFTGRMKKMVVLTSILAFSLSTIPAKNANAVIGIIVIATAKNNTMKTVGWVLAGLGAGASAIALNRTAGDTQVCTSKNPCSNPNCTEWENVWDNCQYLDQYGNCVGGYDYECEQYGPPIKSGTQTYSVSSVDGSLDTIGIVLLGETEETYVQLAQLETKDAKTLGVKPQQVAAFNTDLPKLNLIFNTAYSQINAEALAGASEAQLKADALLIWEQAKPVMSADSYQVLTQLSGAFVQTIESSK